MKRARIGLLPLYIELYDRIAPEARERMESFYDAIATELEARAMEVIRVPVCRLRREFQDAVTLFEREAVDAIVTLHLAYSPSLESVDALVGTKLPIIVLDTTPTYSYAPDQDPAELMYNHGIHGVQDMCNLLTRKGKPFQIEAGHWRESDVLDRTAAWAGAVKLASAMRNARVGLIGDVFEGMGDFQVESQMLDSIGIRTVKADFKALSALLPQENDADVLAEMSDDLNVFDAKDVDSASHLATTRTSAAIDRWMDKECLNAFTMNFDSINRATGLPTIPFLTASKAMARGIGYAGEGDVLTAALTGALMSVYPQTSFTEMFSPDWEHNRIYISHMGEMNLDLVEGKPTLLTKSLPWIDVEAPTAAVGCFMAGEAVFINLAPGPDDSFTLILAPVSMVSPDVEDRMLESVRGWFEPSIPVADFLADYSRLGGTHHAALVYGDAIENLIRFGELMSWNVAVLG